MPVAVLVAETTVEYRDFISAGTAILTTIVITLGGIQVALINRTNNNAKKAALYAEPTGNGYASKTTETLEKLEQSVGALHGRMDRRERHSDEVRSEIREVLVNFDDRLTTIEDKLE